MMSYPMAYFAFIFIIWTAYAVDVIFRYVGEYLDEKQARDNIYDVVEYTPYTALAEERVSLHSAGHEEKYTGFAYSEENNPNPELFNRVRTIIKYGMIVIKEVFDLVSQFFNSDRL